MSYLEELLPEFRKGAKIRLIGSRDNEYYYIKHNVIYNQNGTPIKDFSLSIILADVWEFYKEPIDWNYIIKNKCLCYFSNYDYSANYFGYLKGREDDNCFIDNKLNNWNNCRPVRRDEVTFYEDKKDER